MALNVVERFHVGGFEYQLRLTYCGKATCTKCPHGPYWYMIMHLNNGTKPTKYIGKELPLGVNRPPENNGNTPENSETH